MSEITIGLGLHRPELIPWVAERMRRYEAIFLEEPGSPDFDRMLSGNVSIDDYLLPLDVVYPDFSRAMCMLLRELHAEGKSMHQVEPFVECLICIQEFFAEGHRPDDLAADSLDYHVYRAEHAATGALLGYYQTVLTGTFDQAVDAVLRFARVDAARFRLRDSLRAQELARLIPRYSSSFVEAGLMHYGLWRLLRRRLPCPDAVRPVFVAPAAQGRSSRGRPLYGPGDQLTLRYVFHPEMADRHRERLLAARSMIHSKILPKQESGDEGEPVRHLRNERVCIEAVRGLSLEDCGRLFPAIRRAGSLEARRRLMEFLPPAARRELARVEGFS
jgi:hypothetical protein